MSKRYTENQIGLLKSRMTRFYAEERKQPSSVELLWERMRRRTNEFAEQIAAPTNSAQGWRSFYRRYVSLTHSNVIERPVEEVFVVSPSNLTPPSPDKIYLNLVKPEPEIAPYGSVQYYRDLVGSMSDVELHNHLFGIKNEFGEYEAFEKPLPAYSRMLVIADVHFPFVKVGYLAAIIDAIKTLKPDAVLFIGDAVDAYCFSAWPKAKNTMNGNSEIALAGVMMEHWERELGKFGIPVYLTLGNHDARLYRLMHEIGIAPKTHKGLTDYLKIPSSWECAHSWIDSANNIEYTHVPPRGGAAPQTLSLQSTDGHIVFGHIHSTSGVTCNAAGKWGMLVGCALDPKLYANAYANKANHKVKSVTFGYGVVDIHPTTGVKMWYTSLKGTKFDV